MANTFAPFGFMQQGNTEGASPTFGMFTRLIAAGDSAVYTNDPLKLLNTGYVSKWTVGTAVSQLAGMFMGCQYQSSQGLIRSPYWPGSGSVGDVTAFIVPCNLSVPGLFLVQSGNSNTTATPIAFAQIGENIDVAMGTGSTAQGISGAYADQFTLGVTATLPFRIMGLYNGVGNGSDAASANNWIFVAANVSGAGSTGI